VTVAVDGYPDAPPGFAEAIKEQVTIIEEWAGVPVRFSHLAAAPSTSRDVDGVRYGLEGLDQDDIVLLYVTGHGLRLEESREHRLLLPDHSGYRTADLVLTAMTSGAGHVGVLVDSCYAGALYTQVYKLLQDIRQDRESLVTLPGSCCVMVSGHPDQTTRLREFATVLRRALDLLASDKFAPPTNASHLSPQLFFDIVREATQGQPVPPQWVWPPALEVSAYPCLALPNPVWEASEVVTGASVRDLALSGAQVRDYWIEKASGRPGADDQGWYFTGRRHLMAQVVAFLHDSLSPRAGHGVLVVTGEAGSGKSAVIARAVTLADQTFRDQPEFADLVGALQRDSPELVPAPGCIDVAVMARGLSTERMAAAVIERLAGVAGARPTDNTRIPVRRRMEQAAHQAADMLGRPVIIVLDGVDEADDPAGVVREVVQPLVDASAGDARPLARLVLGVRSSAGDDTDPASLVALIHGVTEIEVTQIRTDGPQTATDLREYLLSILVALPTSPYAEAPDEAVEAARVVAEAVTPRFLDARVVGDSLRRAARKQRLDDPGWLASLSDATVNQLRQDVADVAGLNGVLCAEIVAVLRATAIALGTGLPWEHVWPTVARAVLDRDFPDADTVIQIVVESRLNGYLTTASEDGRRVYRPNHERLTEVLREDPGRIWPGEGRGMT
jgi:hypothetical protein